MATSSSLSSSRSWNYDVFLSFKGEDTRKNFVDHLYSALKQRLIRTYKDDETLPRGDTIGPSLMKAIKESRVAIIIFSKNYADSSWCLDELECIMKCREERGLIVFPVFYDVDPSELRNQKGDFRNAFTKSESWRKALVDASKIAGWEPKNIANGHESKIIKEILDTVFGRLFPLNSDVDEELVGMKARLEDLKTRLQIGSGGVRMIGIWGVGGSGKTTLASTVYLEISRHFEGHCIVDNIREESSKLGLKNLQEKFLSTVLKTKIGVQSVEEGKHMIKSRLCHSNLLVLLDDVDDHAQLEALVGSHNWFGSGSRIIITTRNEHLLRKHKVDHVSPVILLSHDEATRLFKRHAYNEKGHVKDYDQLSLRVVCYAAGLPLALKVLGSFLYDKNEKEWMSTLVRLKDIPEMEIVEKLKVSYDGLKSVEKELFLDIACFFRGKSKDDAMEILEACGFYPDIGITVLSQKGLVTVSEYGIFDMHDLVQEMGHYIVRGEHLKNPEKHSRVWKNEEIKNMCLRNAKMENYKTEAIQFDGYSYGFCDIISNMKKLRWVCVINRHHEYAEGPNFLSNELRYIYWQKYPKSTFPEKFHPLKLVVLKLPGSLQRELWKCDKHLPQLKMLELGDAKNLLSTPDFGELPSLQKLKLYSCDKLEEVHPSLGNHRSIEYVSVSDCRKLRMFPTITQMEKLETLEIKYCHRSFEFPEIQAKVGSLIKLSLNGIGIQLLLSSINDRCPNLIFLYMIDCFILKNVEVQFDGLLHLKEFRFRGFTRPDEKIPEPDHLPISPLTDRDRRSPLLICVWLIIPQLTHNLKKLDLRHCRLGEEEIPSDIGKLFNLTELDLSWNPFSHLDFSLSQLTRLKLLNLTGCRLLVKLPELPSSIATLKADSCKSLTTLGDFHTKCKWLCEVSLIEGIILNDGDKLLQSMLQGKAIENHAMFLRLQGNEIPKRFRPPLLRGNKCTLPLPENWCNDFCGFLICAVLTSDFPYFDILVVMGVDCQDDVVWEGSVGDEKTWVGYVSFGSLRHTAWWDSTYNAVSFSIRGVGIRGAGVTLVPRKNGCGQTETLQDSFGFSDEKDDDYTYKFKIYHDSTFGLKFHTKEWYD